MWRPPRLAIGQAFVKISGQAFDLILGEAVLGTRTVVVLDALSGAAGRINVVAHCSQHPQIDRGAALLALFNLLLRELRELFRRGVCQDVVGQVLVK